MKSASGGRVLRVVNCEIKWDYVCIERVQVRVGLMDYS